MMSVPGRVSIARGTMISVPDRAPVAGRAMSVPDRARVAGDKTSS